MKYLVLLVVIGVVLWAMGARRRVGGGAAGPGGAPRPGGRAPVPQAMLACAHCGMHLPVADVVSDGERPYCCEAHRRLGPANG